MAEAVATPSPLMAALTKIKESAMHVISQVRASAERRVMPKKHPQRGSDA